MTDTDPGPADIARLQRAAEWLQRLNESSDQALADQWLEWCQSDPRNLLAYEHVQRIWNGFPAITRPAEQPRASSRPTRRRIALGALAASVLLAVGVVGWLALGGRGSAVLATAIGQQRRIDLPDGSVLDLAPDSRATTRFTSARREVSLERGHAYFTVAHSVARPFVVRVSGLTVTAAGTAFDVRIGPSRTVVSVSEGRVDVATAGAGSDRAAHAVAPVWPAGAGERVTLAMSSRQVTVAPVDPTVAGSWRGGTLQFIGEPLQDVLSEVNRYGTRRILVAPSIQQARFTGTVSLANVDEWLKAVEQIYAVELVDQGTDGITIQPRSRHATSG